MTGVERLERAILDRLTRDGPADLAELNAAVTFPVRVVNKVLRRMARRKLVICKKVNPAGRAQRAGEISDSARLIWALPGQTITPTPALRAGLTVVPLPTRRRRSRKSGPSSPLRKSFASEIAPHSADRPEPIEILARMAGRTNFITPKESASSTATVPVTPLDIAHAIATAPDKLGSTLALAIACQKQDDWEKIEFLGLPRVRAQLSGQRLYPGVISGHKKVLARIALMDSFEFMVAPARRPPYEVAAARWEIAETLYKFLIYQATCVLEAAANTAAKDAVDFLFANYLRRYVGRNGAVLVHENGFEVLTGVDLAEVLAHDPQAMAFDLADLLEQTIERPRMPGVLSIAT